MIMGVMRIKSFRVLLLAGFYWIIDDSIVKVHFDIFILHLVEFWCKKSSSGFSMIYLSDQAYLSLPSFGSFCSTVDDGMV